MKNEQEKKDVLGVFVNLEHPFKRQSKTTVYLMITFTQTG